MTWTRLSDDFTERFAMLKCSRSARLLLIEMYVYANRLETDGEVPLAAMRRLTDSDDYQNEIHELVEADLIEWAETCVRLDWSEQEEAEDVQARRKYQAEKQKRYRSRRDKHARNDHSECDSNRCKAASVTGNATGNVTGLVTPSRPVPSRPQGRVRDQGADQADSAGATSADRSADNDASSNWSGWTQGPKAQEFQPASNGRCAFTIEIDDAVHVCQDAELDWPHFHPFIQDAESAPYCSTCDQQRYNPVHARREDGDA